MLLSLCWGHASLFKSWLLPRRGSVPAWWFRTHSVIRFLSDVVKPLETLSCFEVQDAGRAHRGQVSPGRFRVST